MSSEAEVKELATTENIESGTTSTDMSIAHDMSVKKDCSSVESPGSVPIFTDQIEGDSDITISKHSVRPANYEKPVPGNPYYRICEISEWIAEQTRLKADDTSSKECDLHLTAETNALHIAPNTSSKRKANTSKDRMKDKSFLPYYSVDRSYYSRYTDGAKIEKPCYSGYSDGIKTHSSSESENLSDDPEPDSVNEELSSRVTMFEELAHETIGDLVERNTEQTENYEGKKSSDDEIIILDVIPSPIPVQSRYSLPTSNKGFCKPNLKFSSEVGVKKSKMSTQSTGDRRELWKQELKDKINEKKEANFIRKQQLQLIDNEDCENMEVSDADKKFADGGRKSEKERERIKNLPFALGKPEEESPIESDTCEDYDADGDNEYESDTTGDEDEDQDQDEDEDDSESSGFKPTSPDSKHSDLNSPSKFKNVPAHIRYLSPDMAYGKKLNEPETVQNAEVSNIDDPLLDTEAICFSLPSYQPCGGFANLIEEETIACDVVEDSPPSCSAVSACGLGNEETREENNSSIPVITISSSDSDQKAESHLKTEKPSIEHHCNFMSLCETVGDADFFDDSGVSQMCSGAFPSTSKSDLPNSASSNSQPLERGEDKTSTQMWSKDSDKISEDAESPLKRARRKRAIIESDDDDIIEIPITSPLKTASHTPIKLFIKRISEDESDHLKCSIPETKVRNESSQETGTLSHYCFIPDFDNEVAQKEKERLELERRICEEEVTDECLEEVYADKDNLIRGFIEDEAELSGEELSSDEDENNLDEAEKGDDDVIEEEIPEDSEVLRNQIGLLHFKQMENEDSEFLKRVKNDFLDEGEFYSESSEIRKKKYSWANKELEQEAPGPINVSESDDDSEVIDHHDKLKWKKENVEGDAQNEPADQPSTTRKFKVLNKVNLITQDTSSLKRKRGSLIHREDLLQVKKIKVGSSSSTSTVLTTHSKKTSHQT